MRFVRDDPRTRELAVGLFGASTGAAAALQVAARFPGQVSAVVSRGGRRISPGRPRCAASSADAPRRGGHDYGVIELNEAAFAELRCPKELAIVPGATHLFEEPAPRGGRAARRGVVRPAPRDRRAAKLGSRK